jgi:hypothetical protein
MDARVHCSEHASFRTNFLVPSLLVKVNVLTIELVKEARVPDVQLVWGNSNDGA